MTDRQMGRCRSSDSRRCSVQAAAASSVNNGDNGSVTFASIPPSYSCFADDLAVSLSSDSRALVWLHGPSGSGKTTFLKRHLNRWPLSCIWVDLRREHEVMSSEVEVLPDKADQDETVPPLLILDGVSPRDLMILLSDPGHLAGTLVPGFEGPVMVVSPFDDVSFAQQLAAYTGRQLLPVPMPQSSAQERLAILREHQPDIERRWSIELAPCALETAASGEAGLTDMTPGASLQLLEAAAARMAILSRHGPRALRVISEQLHDANREMMVAQARGYDIAALQQTILDLGVAKTAYEVDWQEQRRDGIYKQLTRHAVEDELHYGLFGRGDSQVGSRVDSPMEPAW